VTPLLTGSESAKGIEYEFAFGKANLAGRRGLLEIIPELRAARETLERLECINQYSSVEDAQQEISKFSEDIMECPVYSEMKVSALDYRSLEEVKPIADFFESSQVAPVETAQPEVASEFETAVEATELPQLDQQTEQYSLMKLGNEKVLASLETFTTEMLDAMREVASDVNAKSMMRLL
jgi:hypothetical protein